MMSVIEYKLRFLLDSLTLQIKSITNITDTKKVFEFNRVFCDTKKIQAFCGSLADGTSFPLLGVPLSKSGTTHRVYFCEVAVGASLYVGREYAANTSMPNGADSLIVQDGECSAYLNKETADLSRCSYLVKDSRKILPLYEVVFEYDPVFEQKSRNRNICHRCADEEAVVFCPSERANFCEACDKAVHCDAFHSRHERKYFADVGVKKFICCEYHPAKIVEYFCEECAEPLCPECQITGKHSSSEFASHKIKPFLDACCSASKDVRTGDAAILAQLDKVDSVIGRCMEATEGFKGNIALCRRQIEREFNRLLYELTAIENTDMQVCNAQFIERMREREYIRRMVSYPEELDPADILLGLRCISEQRTGLVFSGGEIPTRAHAKLQGKMSVVRPKEAEAHAPQPTKSEDLAVGRRLETMNLVGHAQSTPLQ